MGDEPIDPELLAMSTIHRQIGGLEPAAQQRVLRWVVERLGLEPRSLRPVESAPRRGAPLPVGEESSSEGSEVERPVGPVRAVAGVGDHHETLGEFFSALGPPETAPLRVLAVAAYLQVREGQTELPAYAVSARLKDLGYGVANITDAFTSLMDRRPQLVIQVSKSGRSRQARKTYRVTASGLAEIQRMLPSGPSSFAPAVGTDQVESAGGV